MLTQDMRQKFVKLYRKIERLGMSDLFGEIMVPSEEVVEMRGGQEEKPNVNFSLVTFLLIWN